MEDILDVYTRPHDPRVPQSCPDETGKQLLRDVRDPLPLGPARPAREDADYARGGVANLFMVREPLAGRRRVTVTEHRTKVDWAQVIKTAVDEWYPAAERIVLVQDNLNTHTPAALYEAFAPEEAKRLVDKIEWHYTPKHGSWLDMAEVELSALSRQCLDRRIPDIATLDREITARLARRNAAGAAIDWRFTTDDARIKLKRLYPSVQT
jgi:hypothetical protein